MKDQINTESSDYGHGYEDFQMGYGYNSAACPRESVAKANWQAGWKHAEEDSQAYLDSQEYEEAAAAWGAAYN